MYIYVCVPTPPRRPLRWSRSASCWLCFLSSKTPSGPRGALLPRKHLRSTSKPGANTRAKRAHITKRRRLLIHNRLRFQDHFGLWQWCSWRILWTSYCDIWGIYLSIVLRIRHLRRWVRLPHCWCGCVLSPFCILVKTGEIDRHGKMCHFLINVPCACLSYLYSFLAAF